MSRAAQRLQRVATHRPATRRRRFKHDTYTAVDLFSGFGALSQIALEDCYFRMLGPHEIGRGCGFDVSFPGYGHEGTFVVWGSARDQTDGFGNAVTPAVGEWIGTRLREALHRTESVA